MTSLPVEGPARAFLDLSNPPERRPGWAAATLVLGAGAGGLAALLALALVLLAASLAIALQGGDGLATAVKLLTQSDRPGRTAPSYIYELALVGLPSLAFAAGLVAVAARRAKRPIRSFLTGAPRFRWRHALGGLVIFLPVVGLEIGLEMLISPPDEPAPLFAAHADLVGGLAYAAAAVVFLWCAALAEEIIFRGWLMQQTGAFTRSVAVVLAVNGLVFSLAHSDPSIGAFVTRCALGATWAWIVLRLGGIEFTAGAHLANNLGIALLAQPVTFATPKAEPFDPLAVGLQVGTVLTLAAGVAWWTRRAATAPAGVAPGPIAPELSTPAGQ